MKRGTPLFERSHRDLFRSVASFGALADGLGDLRLGKDDLVHLIAVAGVEDPAIVLQQHAAMRLPEGVRADGGGAFSYVREFGRKRRNTVRGDFVVVPTNVAHVHLIAYVGPNTFIRFGLDFLLDRCYPRLTRPFLMQRELREILEKVESATAPDKLRIREYSAKKRLKHPARRRFESLRDWTDLDLDAAFAEAKERNTWFQSLTVESVPGDTPGRWTGTHVRLSKYGHVAVDGNFDMVRDTVIPALVESTEARLRLLSNRGRVDTEAHEVRTLQIKYDRPALHSPQEIRRLLDGLKKFPHGSCTVLHGNPYLHVSLVDSRDFSAADVWVLSDDKILIVPQLRASYAALKRLINHVFENFGEGTIGEPTEA